MGTHPFEPRDAPPQVVGCPRCLDHGEVMPVPAAAGYGLNLPAAAPRVRFGRRPLGALWFGGLAAMVAGYMIAAAAGTTRVSLPAALITFGVTGGLSAYFTRDVVRVLRLRRRIRAGQPAALELWMRGWFCRRCGMVYFQPGYEPRSLGLHQALSLSEFRVEVYRAGGYEDVLIRKKS